MTRQGKPLFIDDTSSLKCRNKLNDKNQYRWNKNANLNDALILEKVLVLKIQSLCDRFATEELFGDKIISHHIDSEKLHY